MTPPNAPRPDDPYRDCAVYLEHGACVCSTGYPALCQADQPSQHAPTEREPICPGCGHEGHAGFCDECGCLDDRTFKPAPPNAPTNMENNDG